MEKQKRFYFWFDDWLEEFLSHFSTQKYGFKWQKPSVIKAKEKFSRFYCDLRVRHGITVG